MNDMIMERQVARPQSTAVEKKSSVTQQTHRRNPGGLSQKDGPMGKPFEFFTTLWVQFVNP